MNFEYVSHWRLRSPPARVWAALTEVEAWSQWWPYVRQVQTLRRGDASGLGALRRITWGSRLPYGFTLDVECTEAERERRLRGRASGQLQGEGLWELTPAGDGGTRLRYTWRLELNTRWMRLLAPLAAPLFRWNHDSVMRAGERGLQRWLDGDRVLQAAPRAF